MDTHLSPTSLGWSHGHLPQPPENTPRLTNREPLALLPFSASSSVGPRVPQGGRLQATGFWGYTSALRRGQWPLGPATLLPGGGGQELQTRCALPSVPAEATSYLGSPHILGGRQAWEGMGDTHSSGVLDRMADTVSRMQPYGPASNWGGRRSE